MHCGGCGSDNPAGAKFCIGCGIPFKNRCPSCGVENLPQARFCAECGVRYETVLHVSGDPARTILEVEKELGADLLVMATHGVTGLFHLLLGSLTEKMVREAGCPVLSIRQRPEVPPRSQGDRGAKQV